MTTKAIKDVLEWARRHHPQDTSWIDAAELELTTLRRDAKTATDGGCIRAPYGTSEDVRAAWRRLQDVAKEAP